MILIISTNSKDAQRASRMFYYSEILSYATTPHKALNEISPMYRGIIVINPMKFPDIRDYINKIRSYEQTRPIFCMSSEPLQPHYQRLFDACLGEKCTLLSLFNRFRMFQEKHNLPYVGDYRLAAINMPVGFDLTLCFERVIHLTRKERLILKYLIRIYPNPVSSKKIIKYVYPPTMPVEESCIRAHICSINKKYSAEFGRNIITMIPTEGYVIITPKLVYDRNLPIEL